MFLVMDNSSTRATDYLCRLNRNAHSRLTDEDYASVGTWGSAGDAYDIETHALLMVTSGQEARAEALMESDPGVVEYEVDGPSVGSRGTAAGL